MVAIKPFSPNNHKPTERTNVPNSPPDGWPAMLVDGAEKNSASTPGASYVALTFEITDGPHKSRKVFHNLNLNNPNADAVRFATDDLYYLCLACGVTAEIGDTAQLLRLPLRIVTKLTPRKPRLGQQSTGELNCVITEFRRRDGSSVKKSSGGQTSAPQNNHASPGDAPFRR